jgi:hypothetical protein
LAPHSVASDAGRGPTRQGPQGSVCSGVRWMGTQVSRRVDSPCVEDGQRRLIAGVVIAGAGIVAAVAGVVILRDPTRLSQARDRGQYRVGASPCTPASGPSPPSLVDTANGGTPRRWSRYTPHTPLWVPPRVIAEEVVRQRTKVGRFCSAPVARSVPSFGAGSRIRGTRRTGSSAPLETPNPSRVRTKLSRYWACDTHLDRD